MGRLKGAGKIIGQGMTGIGVHVHVNLEMHKESIENLGKSKIKKQLGYILLGVM